MTAPRVSQWFTKSYEEFGTYPTNLIYRTTYQRALEAYQNRLQSVANKLCLEDDDIDVGFRDFTENGQKDARNVQDMDELKSRLGDASTIDTTGRRTGEMVTKADPRCRFIFFLADHSRAALNMSIGGLRQILSYHQVMPTYLDFILVFGRQDEHRELRFGGFREQTFLNVPMVQQTANIASTTPTTANIPNTTAAGAAAQPIKREFQPNPAVEALGRSGKCFQLAWNYKAVVNKSEEEKSKPEKEEDTEWTIRQAAFHHQFDVTKGTTLWICTSGTNEVQERVQDLTGKNAKPEDIDFSSPESCFRSTLAVHLLLGHWSTNGWRDYLRWLEDVIEKKTNPAILGSRDAQNDRAEYTSADVQAIQRWSDRVNDVTMVLDANADVMMALKNFYVSLKDDPDFSLKDRCAKDITSFTNQVGEMIADLRLQAARAKVVGKITSSRKDLVVQHLQSQAAEEMRFLANESQREAIAMRVIAGVTVFYLPATFVSSLFSTDIVKFQNPNGGKPGTGNFSFSATWIWLIFTVPLTLLTLAMALLWYYRSDKRRRSWGVSWTKHLQAAVSASRHCQPSEK